MLVLVAAMSVYYIPVIRQTGHGQWFLFFFAIAMAAICFGLYPGLLALLLSLVSINVLVLSQEWITHPLWSFNLNVGFCILSGVIVGIAHSQQNLVKQLYESQQDLSLAQEVAQVGSWRFKVKGDELFWTDEKYRIFEIAVGTKVTIDTFFSAIHPDDREYVDRMWQASLRGEPYDIEHRIIVVGGKVKWIREKAILEFAKDGALLGGFGTTQDITVRKFTEQELRDKEEKLRLIMDLTPNLVCYLDTDFRYVRINKTYETWWNKKSEQILGHEVREIVGEPSWGMLQPYMERTIMGEVVSFDYQSLNGNDAIQWLHVDYVPDLDSAGVVKGIVVQVANITERKLAEQKLIEQDNQLQLIINSMPALVAYVGTDFRYIRANSTYTKWFGILTEQVIGFEIKDVVGETAWQRIKPYMEKAMLGKAVHYELEMLYRTVKSRWIHANYVPHMDSNGNVIGVVALIVDIGEIKQAEHEIAKLNLSLIHRLEELKAIFDTTPIGIAIAEDRWGKRIQGNPALEEMIGLPPHSDFSLREKNYAPYKAYQEGRQLTVNELPMQRAIRGEIVENQIIDVVRPDGSLITLLSKVVPLYNESRIPRGAVGAFMDITALKSAELALKTSEERLRLAQKAGMLGVYDHNLISDEMQWDERLRTLWGLEPDEAVVLATFMERLHPDDRAYVKAAVKRSFDPQNNGEYYAEYRVIRPFDKKMFWVAAYGTTTFTDSRPVRIVGFVQDISERKLAEAKLRDTEARLALALDELNAGYWEWELEGNKAYYSPVWKQQLGYEDHELPNRHEEWENRLHPDDRDYVFKTVESHLNNFIPTYEIEFRLRHKDGSYRWIHSRAGLTHDHNKRLIRMVGLHLDITDFKKAAELNQQRELIEESFRFNIASQTVAAIAHELNQPLTAISHFSDVAVDMVKSGNQNPEKLADILESCSIQAQRAGEVIRQLMVLLQKGEFLSEPVDINKMVDFAYEYVIKNNNLISFVFEPKLTHSLPNVLANSLHIQKILIILIENSWDAMQENKNSTGKLTIYTRLYPSNLSMVQITVSDAGIGVSDANMLNKIFQPFYSTKPTGLGMGLAISRALIEAHGGKMWAEPNVDMGMSIHFTLPVAL